ncbi:hypothetical protein PENSPDRAFT_384092 [Peniophora sp. CONT]|nr:hypothetical protein PENSPDRAFT_384092 [Peniophora sp. CONT]
MCISHILAIILRLTCQLLCLSCQLDIPIPASSYLLPQICMHVITILCFFPFPLFLYSLAPPFSFFDHYHKCTIPPYTH